MYTVSQLFIHPVKSARHIEVNTMPLNKRGPCFDRDWMVVDGNGRFLTQRQQPRMCLIETTLQYQTLLLSAPDMPSIKVSMQPDKQSAAHNSLHDVVIWKDTVAAVDCGDMVAQWLSTFLGVNCRLVQMLEHTQRLVDSDYVDQHSTQPPPTVGFADGFPLLLISQASLDEFNRQLLAFSLTHSVGMPRFRPNIVIQGGEPYIEDSWKTVMIGETVLSLVKPCSRCIIPSIDPASANKQPDVVKVLNETRRRGAKILFGQNALHSQSGVISVGDKLEVIE